ncbi:MAG: hypothetical protein ACXWUG_03290 [Polyangiales bacterium]
MRLAIAAILLVSCAKNAPSPPQPATVADEWSQTSWEDRHDAMTWMVLPNMARAFQRFHGSEDPTLTCRSCHGKDAEEVGYAMPHGLPKLARIPRAGDPTLTKTERFMIEEVVPQMREMLGAPNLSCESCHPKS